MDKEKIHISLEYRVKVRTKLFKQGNRILATGFINEIIP